MKPGNHPTGITAVVASALVIVAGKAGVELSVEEAATLIAAVTAIVSVFTPRHA